MNSLSKALQHNTCLTTLDLSQNKISNSGMTALLELVMVHNKVLRHLVLFDNTCDEAKLRMIQEIVVNRHPTDIRRQVPDPHTVERLRIHAYSNSFDARLTCLSSYMLATFCLVFDTGIPPFLLVTS